MKNFSDWLIALAVVSFSTKLTFGAAEKPLQHYEILYQRNIFAPEKQTPATDKLSLHPQRTTVRPGSKHRSYRHRQARPRILSLL